MPLLPLLVAALVPPQAAFEVPFRIAEDAIIVDATVNGKLVSLLFDTGYGGSVIVDQSLNVGPASGKQGLRDFVGTFEATTVKLNSLSIGGKKVGVQDMKIVQQPMSRMSEGYGMHVSGILGLEPFKPYVTEINFERSRIIFHPSTVDITKRKPDNKRTFLAKLLPIGNDSMEMEVATKAGKKMIMALDTGNAFYSTTHRDVLERVGLWPAGQKAKYMGVSGVASGPVDSFHKQMTDVTIFGVPVAKSVWSVIDLPSSDAEGDGTIGFGFLKNFNITFDYDKRRVWLENWTGKVASDDLAEVGISAATSERTRRVQIYRVSPDSPAAKAGIQENDEILAIDGVDLEGTIGFRRLSKMLEGPEGSKVKLVLSRRGSLIRQELVRTALVNE